MDIHKNINSANLRQWDETQRSFSPPGHGILRECVRIACSLMMGLFLLVTSIPAIAVPDNATRFVTLGTAGGPLANPKRSQPANLLMYRHTAILIDAGDGAVQQLAKAGVMLPRLTAVVLSHLHWDHTGVFSLFLACAIKCRSRVNLRSTVRLAQGSWWTD